MGYVLVGILVILVVAAGSLLIRRGAGPHHEASDAGGSSPLGDTTEHSDVPTPPRTGRRG